MVQGDSVVVRKRNPSEIIARLYAGVWSLSPRAEPDSEIRRPKWRVRIDFPQRRELPGAPAPAHAPANAEPERRLGSQALKTAKTAKTAKTEKHRLVYCLEARCSRSSDCTYVRCAYVRDRV